MELEKVVPGVGEHVDLRATVLARAAPRRSAGAVLDRLRHGAPVHRRHPDQDGPLAPVRDRPGPAGRRRRPARRPTAIAFRGGLGRRGRGGTGGVPRRHRRPRRHRSSWPRRSSPAARSGSASRATRCCSSTSRAESCCAPDRTRSRPARPGICAGCGRSAHHRGRRPSRSPCSAERPTPGS